MRWAGNVAGVGETRNLYTNLTGNPAERDHLGDLSFDGKIKGS
jgi:hypothetical protein